MKKENGKINIGLGILAVSSVVLGGASIPLFETYNMTAIEYTQYIDIINQEVAENGPIVLSSPGNNKDEIQKEINKRLKRHSTQGKKYIGTEEFTAKEYEIKKNDLIQKSENLKRESLLDLI